MISSSSPVSFLTSVIDVALVDDEQNRHRHSLCICSTGAQSSLKTGADIDLRGTVSSIPFILKALQQARYVRRCQNCEVERIIRTLVLFSETPSQGGGTGLHRLMSCLKAHSTSIRRELCSNLNSSSDQGVIMLFIQVKELSPSRQNG